MLIENFPAEPEHIHDRYRNHLRQVSDFLTVLQGMFPEIPMPILFQAAKEPQSLYEDDGHTPTPGTHYSFLWIVPILRIPLVATEEYWLYYQMGQGERAVYFHSSFDIRDSDHKAKGCASFTLAVAPMRLDESIKNSTIRVDYNTTNILPMNANVFVRTALLIQRIQNETAMLAKLRTVYDGKREYFYD